MISAVRVEEANQSRRRRCPRPSHSRAIGCADIIALCKSSSHLCRYPAKACLRCIKVSGQLVIAVSSAGTSRLPFLVRREGSQRCEAQRMEAEPILLEDSAMRNNVSH